MGGKYATPPTPISAYVAAAPHSMASFSPLLLCLTTAALPVGQEVSGASCHSPLSCGHFLVFCPSTQRAAVALSPRGELRQAGGSNSSYRRPPPTLRRLLAFTTHGAVAGLKVKISHGAVSFPECPVLPK